MSKQTDKINKLGVIKQSLTGIQFLFVAFGATVLVPLLIGIDPSIALFTAGVGTLIFHFITKGKVPIFLGSSFVFITPIIECTKLYGYPGTLGGLIAVGGVYVVVSAIINKWGLRIIEKLFPPVVVGPIIMLIGLSLAGVGVKMASSNWFLALSALATAVIIVSYTKGFIKLMPIMGGIVAGYIVATITGVIDYTPIINADWFIIPPFIAPTFSWKPILYMIPVAVAPIIEHIGDMYAIGGVANKNFVKDPGVHRTLLGDGIATAFAGFFGGPPNTTYSEVTGAISLTKITNPKILRISAVTAIVISVIGKVSGALKTIPESVLGGIMLLLFGMIASIGIKSMVENKVNMNHTKNQVVVSLVMTIGIGGAVLQYGTFSLAGIGLASVVGVFLNLVLPSEKLVK
ncbi:MAG: uracil permease [Bacteroidales bacterium]|nr:uracil permease [Bacteroidales bacterium]